MPLTCIFTIIITGMNRWSPLIPRPARPPWGNSRWWISLDPRGPTRYALKHTWIWIWLIFHLKIRKLVSQLDSRQESNSFCSLSDRPTVNLISFYHCGMGGWFTDGRRCRAAEGGSEHQQVSLCAGRRDIRSVRGGKVHSIQVRDWNMTGCDNCALAWKRGVVLFSWNDICLKILFWWCIALGISY